MGSFGVFAHFVPFPPSSILILQSFPGGFVRRISPAHGGMCVRSSRSRVPRWVRLAHFSPETIVRLVGSFGAILLIGRHPDAAPQFGNWLRFAKNFRRPIPLASNEFRRAYLREWLRFVAFRRTGRRLDGLGSFEQLSPLFMRLRRLGSFGAFSPDTPTAAVGSFSAFLAEAPVGSFVVLIFRTTAGSLVAFFLAEARWVRSLCFSELMHTTVSILTRTCLEAVLRTNSPNRPPLGGAQKNSSYR